MKQKFHATNDNSVLRAGPVKNRDSLSGDYLSAPVGYEPLNVSATPELPNQDSTVDRV